MLTGVTAIASPKNKAWCTIYILLQICQIAVGRDKNAWVCQQVRQVRMLGCVTGWKWKRWVAPTPPPTSCLEKPANDMSWIPGDNMFLMAFVDHLNWEVWYGCCALSRWFWSWMLGAMAGNGRLVDRKMVPRVIWEILKCKNATSAILHPLIQAMSKLDNGRMERFEWKLGQ